MATDDYGSAGSAQSTEAAKAAPSVAPIPAPIVAPDPTADEAADLAAKQAVVDDAAQTLAEAKVVLALAIAEHKTAQEEHSAAVKALEPVLDPTKHVKLWNGVDYTTIDASKLGFDTDGQGNIRARAISYLNRNFEHVDTDPAGVWCYREM